jgi:hypothetical protein
MSEAAARGAEQQDARGDDAFAALDGREADIHPSRSPSASAR